jgi:hypothetical protein
LGCFASACSLHFTSVVVQMNVCMQTLHFKSFLVINTSMNSLLLYQNLHVVKEMGIR